MRAMSPRSASIWAASSTSARRSSTLRESLVERFGDRVDLLAQFLDARARDVVVEQRRLRRAPAEREQAAAKSRGDGAQRMLPQYSPW